MDQSAIDEELALAEQLDIDAARSDIYAMAQRLAPDDPKEPTVRYNFSWHHRLIYKKLDAFSQGKITRLIIEAPPRHGKSEAVSRNLPAYIFGRNPNAKILACSYTQELATEMNLDVQKIMSDNPYRLIFPGTFMGRRRSQKIFDVGERGLYKCCGVSGGISGRGYDFGIIDDYLKGRAEANSPTIREKQWRWFTGEFFTRRSLAAGILITATRWHEDDLVGRLKIAMAEGRIEPFEIITLPAIATDGERCPGDNRAEGEALWPWRMSVESLEEQRELEPLDFYSLYQQNPRPEGAAEFPSEWLGESVWFTEWPKDITLSVALIRRSARTRISPTTRRLWRWPAPKTARSGSTPIWSAATSSRS